MKMGVVGRSNKSVGRIAEGVIHHLYGILNETAGYGFA